MGVSAMNDAFPFSEAEWSEVWALSNRIGNATLADEDVVRASLMLDFQELLNNLRERYGNHPVLTETEADFTADANEQIELYQQAIREAEQLRLTTCSIRIYYARVLCEDLNQPEQALNLLAECELEAFDDSERRQFAELQDVCNQRLSSLRPKN